ncbi:MAG: uridine kinase [Lachnospiraceae bacterium]
MAKRLVIGIAGGTASGKTTVVNEIRELFGDNITIIAHDNYYKAHDELTYEERTQLNYDHPKSFDTDRMVEDIMKLRAGETVEIPVYDFKIHNRSDEVQKVVPRKIIIVEGVLVLQHKRLRKLMDVRVYVDAPADERLARRIKRDIVERERTLDSVIEQYRETVKPMHEKYVEPSKNHADIIIPRGGGNHVGIGILQSYLKSEL